MGIGRRPVFVLCQTFGDIYIYSGVLFLFLFISHVMYMFDCFDENCFTELNANLKYH